MYSFTYSIVLFFGSISRLCNKTLRNVSFYFISCSNLQYQSFFLSVYLGMHRGNNFTIEMSDRYRFVKLLIQPPPLCIASAPPYLQLKRFNNISNSESLKSQTWRCLYVKQSSTINSLLTLLIAESYSKVNIIDSRKLFFFPEKVWKMACDNDFMAFYRITRFDLDFRIVYESPERKLSFKTIG